MSRNQVWALALALIVIAIALDTTLGATRMARWLYGAATGLTVATFIYKGRDSK